MLDPYSVNDTANELDRHFKPLLSMVIRLNMIYMYACIHIIFWSYFMFHGRRIIKLLDCESLQSIYCDPRRKSIRMFVCFIIINNCYFIMETIKDLRSIFNDSIENFLLLFLQILSSYSLYLDMYMVYGILYYFKYGVLQLLIQLTHNVMKQIQAQQFTNHGLFIV